MYDDLQAHLCFSQTYTPSLYALLLLASLFIREKQLFGGENSFHRAFPASVGRSCVQNFLLSDNAFGERDWHQMIMLFLKTLSLLSRVSYLST